MFRRFTIILILALLFTTASARDRGLTYHEVQVKDEVGKKVTTISSVEIYNADTTTNAVIYKDRALKNAITIPMTTATSNSTLSNGYFYWWGNDGYDYSITDGTNISKNADHRTRTSSDGIIVFPTYLTAIDSSHYLNAQDITFGTASDWVANSAGSDLMTWIPATDGADYHIGSSAKVSDFKLFGDTPNRDLNWDASRDQLAFMDGALLGFGGAAEGAAGDFTIYHTAASSILTITAAAANEAVVFGTGAATDVKFDNSVSAGADVHWDDSEEEWNFGASTLGVDVKTWGQTADTYMLWDESDDELEFVKADLKIGQGSQIEFIDTTAVDWTIDNATDETLLIKPTEITDDQSINLGNATYTTDLRLFGAGTSTVIFDATADYVIFNAYDIKLGDADYLYFGDINDMSLHSTTAKYLTFTPSDADDDSGVILGSDQSGVDLKAFAKTTNEYMEWDASADSLTVVGDLALFTLTGATIPFNVNATTTIDGVAIKLETTEGGALFQIDGDTEGDLAINVGDDYTNTTTGIWFSDVTGQAKLTSSSTSAASVLLTADGGASSTIKLSNTAGTGQDAAHVLIADGGMTVTATTAIDDGAILYVTGMVDTASQLWGGVYADINIGDGSNADTTDGPVYAVQGTLWPQNLAAPTSDVAGAKFGIQETSADLSGCNIYGIVIETLLATGGGDPSTHYMMKFNTSSAAETPDGWFYAANPEAVAYTTNALHTGAATDKLGAIAIKIAGKCDPGYIYIYDHAGR